MLHQLAEVFLKRGMSVVYFDGPGQGEMVGKLSMNIADFDDAISIVIDFLAEQGDLVDRERIGILGVSLGGYLAMRSSVKDRRIAACIGLTGNFDGHCILNVAPKVQRDMLYGFGFGDGEPIPHPDEFIPPLSTLEQAITTPLLLIHGGKDHISTPDQLDKLRAWVRGPTDVWLYEDEGHVCYSRFGDILPAMGDWMADILLTS